MMLLFYIKYLQYVPGIETWTIMNRELEIVESADKIPEKNSNLLHKHLFPPSEEEKKNRNLNRW